MSIFRFIFSDLRRVLLKLPAFVWVWFSKIYETFKQTKQHVIFIHIPTHSRHRRLREGCHEKQLVFQHHQSPLPQRQGQEVDFTFNLIQVNLIFSISFILYYFYFHCRFPSIFVHFSPLLSFSSPSSPPLPVLPRQAVASEAGVCVGVILSAGHHTPLQKVHLLPEQWQGNYQKAP